MKEKGYFFNSILLSVSLFFSIAVNARVTMEDAAVNSINELQPIVDNFVMGRIPYAINASLYNTGLPGQPAPGEFIPYFLETHKHFCSPLSFEQLIPGCNSKNPISLQHGDLKPLIFTDIINADTLPFVENWIKNIITPKMNPDTPNYIKDPTLLNDINNKALFVDRLRDQISYAAVATSLYTIVSKRIPSSSTGESITSSLDKISNNFFDETWLKKIDAMKDPLEVQKEALRTLALIPYSVNELRKQSERQEFLQGIAITNLANIQTILYNSLKIQQNTATKSQ